MDQEGKREAERVRKAEYRARKKSIIDGTYVASAVDQAKKYLESMDDPDVGAAYSDQHLGLLLKPEDKKTLYNFVHHLKSRRRRDIEEETKRVEHERLISEKGMMFVNQKTYELHQALLMTIEEAERVALIKSTIDSNLFLFLEYMETFQMPSVDFLKVVVGLKDRLDKSSFTELFVRVCRYSKIEDLTVSSEMVGDALTFLVEKKKDEKAAFGLLLLIHQSRITLHAFDRTLLIKFQEDFHLTILRFFKSLNSIEAQVAESLPPSMFCFTSPTLKALRDEGRVFYTQIPFQFMPYLVQIVCYSFTQSETSFNDFLDVFKDGMKEHFNVLVENRFTDLLQKLLDETRLMKPKFFGSLDHQATVLKRGFSLLKQKQIEKFTSKIIQDLINGDNESYREMASGARIIAQNAQMKMRPILKELNTLNPSVDMSSYYLDRELSQEDKQYFNALGIQSPLQLQSVCYNFCTADDQKGRWVIQLDTGTGKTALCFAVGCKYVSLGYKVLILNVSEELTFRDYKKAMSTQKDTNISVNFIENAEEEIFIIEGISYVSFKVLSQLFSARQPGESDDIVLLADEFDQIIFGENDHTLQAAELFSRFPILFGLSGSDLKEYHIKALEQSIMGRTMKFNISDIFKPPSVNSGVDVYTRITDYRQVIESISAQQVDKTPVIIIADDERKLLTKKLKNSGVPVETLFQSTFTESNGSLTIFTKKQGGKFPVFIINDSQGRGLDFPSSTEIEEAGGVFLIIGKLPSSFLQYKQFLGRTGRMGNKSQYMVILHDAEANNEDGQTYLEKKLEMLQNYDLQRASSISHILMQRCKEQDANKQVVRGSSDKVEIIQSGSSNDEIKNPDQSMTLKIGVDSKIESETQSLIASSDSCLQSQQNHDSKEESKNQRPTLRKRDTKVYSKHENQGSQHLSQIQKENKFIDEGYFNAYSKIEIHNQMCSDKRRVAAYEAALKASCNGKVVIDVGAGTGILSFMATEAGATKVYAIEKAEIWSKFKREVNKRQLKTIVKVMNCRAEEAPLEDITADVIVSEWMGYFLLCERMLPSVLSVRDKCLMSGGNMIPCRARIIIAAAVLSNIEKVVIHGHQEDVIRLDASTQIVPPEKIASSEAQILEITLVNTQSDFDSFEAEFQVSLSMTTSINAFVGWFEVEMTQDQWLSTSPFEAPTHWEQTVFPIIETQVLAEGSSVEGRVCCKPMVNNYRGLDLLFDFSNLTEGQKMQFNYYVQ